MSKGEVSDSSNTDVYSSSSRQELVTIKHFSRQHHHCLLATLSQAIGNTLKKETLFTFIDHIYESNALEMYNGVDLFRNRVRRKEEKEERKYI
ncbi:hypothetical protein E2C01_011427 [Portunus trituberculatus]|uniref:Uncharacterized protein n=1 Tax=Portunus trituberculatus TaxID=210409 RepID=A0A5B7DB24_PORTR|nr:hypothetical protein [Portunus trituberculatus]